MAEQDFVHCDRVDVWNADGSKEHCYFSPKAEPLPLGRFPAASLPAEVRRALGHLGAAGERFEITRVRIRNHGLFRGV